MKTLIEKFTETVRLTATNFCLTDGLNRDGIDSISLSVHLVFFYGIEFFFEIV